MLTIWSGPINSSLNIYKSVQNNVSYGGHYYLMSLMKSNQAEIIAWMINFTHVSLSHYNNYREREF